MQYRFKYSYMDLGELHKGDTVVVRLRGSRPNVMLLDSPNFARYRGGSQFSYIGGNQHRSPAQLEVPRDGHWYVAMDLGGRGGRVRGSVSVRPRSGARGP